MRKTLAVLLLAGCATTTPPPSQKCDTGMELLHAALWTQSSAEYKAAATQTYNTASRMLDAALDSSPGPAAVILDLDETALDNSGFEARMVQEGKLYDAKEWRAWIAESRAQAVPGVAEFLMHAVARGVTPFYITNRKKDEEEDTRRNLERLGFPLSTTEDTVLTRNERPEWTSNDKSGRRDFVASKFRVLMLLGDDLNDFVNASEATKDQRDAVVRDNAAKWGTTWLIVPNPMYGSWEKPVSGGKTGCEQVQEKVKSLRP